jgi:hypothetical protein
VNGGSPVAARATRQGWSGPFSAIRFDR